MWSTIHFFILYYQIAFILATFGVFKYLWLCNSSLHVPVWLSKVLYLKVYQRAIYQRKKRRKKKKKKWNYNHCIRCSYLLTTWNEFVIRLIVQLLHIIHDHTLLICIYSKLSSSGIFHNTISITCCLLHCKAKFDEYMK